MPTYGTAMIIAQPGKINVQHWRGDAIYQNGMRIISPVYQDLTPSSNPYPGDTFTSTAVYPVGTEVIIELYNVGGEGGSTKTNKTVFAQFQDGYRPGYTWQINWEDGGIGSSDYDYNDSFTYIYTTGTGNINLSRIRYRAFIEEPCYPPINDNYNNAIELNSSIGELEVSNICATYEQNEYKRYFSQAGTVWYKWTAPSAGRWDFWTSPSLLNTPLLEDTSIVAFRGSSPIQSNYVYADNDSGAGLYSLITINAETGFTYYIAIDGNGFGWTKLNWNGPY